MAEVRFTDVSKVYPGGVEAVNDVNLTVEDGSLLVLVGPSGCGKSTTLRMVAGLEEITEGEIHIGGQLVNNVLPKDRDIAMVFQNYALYPHMTVYNNMAFGLKLRKYPRDEIDRRVQEAAGEESAPERETHLISLAELEKRHIRDVLRSTRGRKGEAARILGIDRATLWRKMKRYGMEGANNVA